MSRSAIKVDDRLDGRASEDDPTVTARIVGHLLVGQAGDDGGEQIDFAPTFDACGAKPLGHQLEERAGRRHRCVRRFETGDGALEEELMPNHVLAREANEVFDDGDEFFARISERFSCQAPIEQLLLAVLEHRSIEIELRLEVRVQRGLLEIDAVSEIAQRQAGKSIAVGQRPRFRDDPGAFGSAASSASVDRC